MLRCLSDFSERGLDVGMVFIWWVYSVACFVHRIIIVLLVRDVGWLLCKCEVAFLNILISMLQLP